MIPQILIRSAGSETMAGSGPGSRLKFSIFLVFMLFCQYSFSQSSNGSLDQFLRQNQKALGTNLVALVWKDGKFVYQKQLEKEQGDFNAKYQAPIGPCSQWMTAALVMTFVDEGKLSLDDKVSKFIPIFATYMKTYITIRNCLTNTTGIQADASGAMKLLQKTKFQSLEDEVNSFASKREIEANPGTERYYSHVGPNIAGRVLEIISKKSFDRLMQDRIIRPLKMRGTTFSDQNGGAVNPSGGALSTANDYMNFLIMLLNKGTFEGKRVLSEKAVAEMETAQFAQLPVKYVPKGAEGQLNGLGNWIQPGSATVWNSLNIAGTWPFIDKCHNYAAIIFVKNPTSEPRNDLYQHFKASLDAQMGSCQ
jgi:CubicO group peptidase (beta-lactamase class C family)